MFCVPRIIQKMSSKKPGQKCTFMCVCVYIYISAYVYVMLKRMQHRCVCVQTDIKAA